VPLCGESETDIDLSGMELVHNNLGGAGPNTDEPKELRFSNVLTKTTDENGDPVYIHLVIANKTNYDGRCAYKNGKWGSFGKICMYSGITEFQYSLVADINDTPLADVGVNIEQPFMTFFDFDHAAPKWGSCGEVMQFAADQVAHLYSTTTDTMDIHTASDGTFTVTAIKYGDGKDNVKDPTEMTQAQFDKSVGIAFASTTFTVTAAISDRPSALEGTLDASMCPDGIGTRLTQIAGYSASKTCDGKKQLHRVVGNRYVAREGGADSLRM